MVGALAGVSACGTGFDFDMRDRLGAPFDTSPAVTRAVAARPSPDPRGIISYPNYQVAVARPGDTVADVAARVGLSADALARHNGTQPNLVLRRGEIVVLPSRVDEPAVAGATVAALPPTAGISTSSLADRAGAAIARGESAATPVAAPAGPEPRRHRVERGETAYSIARAYDVPVRSLGQWNGLGDDLSVRAGQILLIPAAAPAPRDAPSAPGSGTVVAAPPSAAAPLPERDETQATPEETPESPALAGETTQASAPAEGRLSRPVRGPIIRAFSKGKNDGIDIQAAPGTPVMAAGDGVVAAITRDTDQVPILVLRHPGNVLTVYAGVGDIAVEKGQTVRRGQPVARVRAGDPSFVHFEVREGFDSVDPEEYLG